MGCLFRPLRLLVSLLVIGVVIYVIQSHGIPAVFHAWINFCGSLERWLLRSKGL